LARPASRNRYAWVPVRFFPEAFNFASVPDRAFMKRMTSMLTKITVIQAMAAAVPCPPDLKPVDIAEDTE